jgi:iron-sulfur cluster repair protein YtfE (RIC family)
MEPEQEATIRWDEDWLSWPLRKLIEHLTEAHREFRERDLPSIERRMEGLLAGTGPTVDAMRSVLPEFRAFRREFRFHMEEEEDFIFPKILRTEESLRHPEGYPEVFKGSVSAYTSEMVHFPEEEIAALAAALERKLCIAVRPTPPSADLEALLGELAVCAAKLKAHAHVESEILFRKAAEMERELRKRNA